MDLIRGKGIAAIVINRLEELYCFSCLQESRHSLREFIDIDFLVVVDVHESVEFPQGEVLSCQEVLQLFLDLVETLDLHWCALGRDRRHLFRFAVHLHQRLSVEELTVEVVFLEEHFDLIASRRFFLVFHAFFYDRDEHLSVYTGLIWASYLGKVIDDIVDVLFQEVVES